jgi:hypothetical protein
MKTHFALFFLLTLAQQAYPMQPIGSFLQWAAQKLGFAKSNNLQKPSQTQAQSASAQPTVAVVRAAAAFTFSKQPAAAKEDHEATQFAPVTVIPSATQPDFSELLTLAAQAAAQPENDWKPQAGEQWQYDPDAGREERILLAMRQHQNYNYVQPISSDSVLKISSSHVKKATFTETQKDLRDIRKQIKAQPSAFHDSDTEDVYLDDDSLDD